MHFGEGRDGAQHDTSRFGGHRLDDFITQRNRDTQPFHGKV
jgi:hypothetical protein